MLRPPAVSTPTCPRCELPGVHNDDDCLAALRSAIAGEVPRPRPIPRPVPPAKPTPIPAVAAPVDPLKPLSIRKACDLVDVTRSTIYNWMKLGKIEWEYTAGGLCGSTGIPSYEPSATIPAAPPDGTVSMSGRAEVKPQPPDETCRGCRGYRRAQL
jgi:hypothetical protein